MNSVIWPSCFPLLDLYLWERVELTGVSFDPRPFGFPRKFPEDLAYRSPPATANDACSASVMTGYKSKRRLGWRDFNRFDSGNQISPLFAHVTWALQLRSFLFQRGRVIAYRTPRQMWSENREIQDGDLIIVWLVSPPFLVLAGEK